MVLNGLASDNSYWEKFKKEENGMSEYIMSRYTSPKMQKEYLEALNNAMEKAGVKSSSITYSSSGNVPGGMWYACYGSDNMMGGHFVTEKDFIPTKIIYSCPATICYFPDGTKTVAKCAEDEEYIKEEGVMACIIKKIFASRNKFIKLVESGYENEQAEIERDMHNDVVATRVDENKLLELVSLNFESSEAEIEPAEPVAPETQVQKE